MTMVEPFKSNPLGKCLRAGCEFYASTDQWNGGCKNDGGEYCCSQCRTSGSHSNQCQKCEIQKSKPH
jgi:hypothetical protein